MNKYNAIILASLFFVMPVHADQIRASETVIIAIQSAQNNNEKKFLNIVGVGAISKFERNAHGKKSLIELLKSIDLEKVEFEDVNATKIVRIVKPLFIEFEIEEIKRENTYPRVVYKIVGVHL